MGSVPHLMYLLVPASPVPFHLQEKQGTVFTLVDSFNRENLGML